MTAFKYIGGQTFSEYRNNQSGDRRVDEREGVDMPDSVVMFGQKFVIGQTVEINPKGFRTQMLYDHAVGKLRDNKFFEEVKPQQLPPPTAPVEPKRGPKSKAADAAELETA